MGGLFSGAGPEFWVIAKVIGQDPQGRPTVLYTDAYALDLGSMQYSTIYAGQSDPADRSHFTIKCEMQEGSSETFYKQVDGWLQNDGSIRLTKTDWRTAD